MNGDTQAILDQLAEAKSELLDARKQRDQTIADRLERLDRGQLEILRRLALVEVSSVIVLRVETRLDFLEKKAYFHDKMIYIAIGALGILNVALPVVLHFWK